MALQDLIYAQPHVSIGEIFCSLGNTKRKVKVNGVYIGTLRVITWKGKTRLILRHSGESFKRFLNVLPEGMTLENLPDPLMNQQLHKLVKNSAVRCWRKNFFSKGEYHEYLEALGYSRKYIDHALWG